MLVIIILDEPINTCTHCDEQDEDTGDNGLESHQQYCECQPGSVGPKVGQQTSGGLRRYHWPRHRSMGTTKAASRAMFQDILDWPESRSAKTMGTSQMRAPLRLARNVVSTWNA